MEMDKDTDADSEDVASRVFSNPSLKEFIFLEAADIFFGSSPSTALQSGQSLSGIVAEQLSLALEQAHWVLNGRSPELDIQRSPSDGRVTQLRVGRATLQAAPRSLASSLTLSRNPTVQSSTFALHRPSLALLERLAIAARFNEPLLLVGETGTGKTTTIQYLATTLSHPLTVFNLSNQTEVSDLVGGFKPVDARVPGMVLHARFSRLFGGTFSSKKNVDFEAEVRKAVHGGKWKRAVAAWRKASSQAIACIIEL
jgi:midasin